MDLEAIKLLLEAQEKTFKTAMDIVVDQLKERIRLVEGTMTELIKSVEFTQAEMVDLKSEVMVLRKSDTDNKKTIDGLNLRIEELEKRANYQEDYNRRNNLRISGMQEQPGASETWEETARSVTKLLEDKLQLPSMKIERAHRTGPASASGSRTIVVRFERFGDREAVLRNARKLKGTGIFINEDLCPASQELRKSQIPLKKKAILEGKIAFFKYTKLIIRDKRSQRPGQTSGGVAAEREGADVTAVPLSGTGGGLPAAVGSGAGGGKPSLSHAPGSSVASSSTVLLSPAPAAAASCSTSVSASPGDGDVATDPSTVVSGKAPADHGSDTGAVPKRRVSNRKPK